jgi:hypothetical protein
MNTITDEQKKHYTMLWTIADADGDGEIGPLDASTFFNRSNVASDILETIWWSVNPNNQPLNIDQFIYYCELLSMAQNNLVPNLQELMQIKLSGVIVPFPLFTGITVNQNVIDVCHN